MRAHTITIPLGSDGVGELPALVVEPDSDQTTASILLFLHGKGEAGSSLGALLRVCVYQTPPFQALLGAFLKLSSSHPQHHSRTAARRNGSAGVPRFPIECRYRQEGSLQLFGFEI